MLFTDYFEYLDYFFLSDINDGGNNQIIAECYAVFSNSININRLFYYQLAGNQKEYNLDIQNVVVQSGIN